MERLTFNQDFGQAVTPVRILRDKKTTGISVSLRQSPSAVHAAHPDIQLLAAALKLVIVDIGFKDLPQVVSTSITRHLVVPLASVEALHRVEIAREKVIEQLSIADANAIGLFLFAQVQGRDDMCEGRFFSPGMSGEDPATGSAAGPLSAYLYRHGLLRLSDGSGKIRVIQGLKMGRNCEMSITLSSEQNDDGE